MQPQPARQSALRTAAVSLATAAVAAAVGFAAVYVTLGRSDNAPGRITEQRRAAAPRPRRPRRMRPRTTPERPRQQSAEQGPDGRIRVPLGAGGPARDQDSRTPRARSARSPTGAARWCSSTCGPPGACPAARRCRPSTACRRSWARQFPGKFEVVALSVDRKGLEASKKFLDETKVERLALYVDPTARANTELRAVGLPGNAPHRPPGPRDRPPARPRRVGRRGRRAADPVGPALSRQSCGTAEVSAL